MLGHWGDVLFSLPQISNNANLKEQTEYVLKMIAKPGGRSWQIEYYQIAWHFL